MSKYWSDIVGELQPYKPGEQATSDGVIKLNTNENAYPPSPTVEEAIKFFSSGSLRLYPDPMSLRLRTAIADLENLGIDNVFVGNGSDEVLAHTFRAFFKNDVPVVFPDVTYSFYPTYCKLFNLSYGEIPLDDDFQFRPELIPSRNGGIIFPNPNAPTGIYLDYSEVELIASKHADSVVVIDEAYGEFGTRSSADLVKKYPNVVVTRSFSKSYSLAGARLGYALANKDLIEGLYRIKDSFNSYPVDRLAEVCALAALRDRTYLNSVIKKIKESRETLTNGLRNLGFRVLNSEANFVFVSHEKIMAESLSVALRERDILVRYFSKPTRIGNFLRITVGTEQQVQKLLASMTEILR